MSLPANLTCVKRPDDGRTIPRVPTKSTEVALASPAVADTFGPGDPGLLVDRALAILEHEMTQWPSRRPDGHMRPQQT